MRKGALERTPHPGMNLAWALVITMAGLVAGVGSSVGTAQATPTGPCGATGLFTSSPGVDTCTHSVAGTEEIFSVPVGVSTVRVTAVGAAGGTDTFDVIPGQSGGLGALVVNDALPVAPGTTLYVDVGENGSSGTSPNNACPVPGGPGGFRDGGVGGAGCGVVSTCVSCEPASGGGGAGGGGSSDISLQPPTAMNLTGNPSTDPRLLVAGGGGGAGGDGYNPAFQSTAVGGSGGNAGDAAVSGAGVGGSPGGIGGPAAGNGTAASGGAGADASPAVPTFTGGGGGGGGWSGGAGGAAGADVNGYQYFDGGQGGGGGSSYGGLGGPVSVTTAAPGQQPSVAITWSPPTTSVVTLKFTGSLTYQNSGPATSSSLVISPSTGVVRSVTGTVTIRGVNGGNATVRVEIVGLFGGYIGAVVVSDPSVGLNTVGVVLGRSLSRASSAQVTGTASGLYHLHPYTLNFTV